MDDLIKILQKLMSESPKPKGGIADTPAGVEFIGRKLTKDEVGDFTIIGSKLTDASTFNPFSVRNIGVENRYSLLREYSDDLADRFEKTITFIKNNPDVRLSQMQKDNILYNLSVYRRVVKEKDKLARGLTEQGKNVDDIFNKRVDNLPDEMLTLEQVLEKFQKNVADMQKKIKETEDIFAPEKVSDERKLRLKRLYDGEGYDRPNSSLYRGYGSYFLPKLHEAGIIKLDDQIYNNLKEGKHHYGGADFFAPDPVRIWRKHFGNQVFQKLDNFDPDNEDIFNWVKRNNIEPIQKDGPKNALEYMTPTEVQQRLTDELDSFNKYKNPESAGDDARFYYADKPTQRMERITYHGENINELEKALQTIDPEGYKEYYRVNKAPKQVPESGILQFKKDYDDALFDQKATKEIQKNVNRNKEELEKATELESLSDNLKVLSGKDAENVLNQILKKSDELAKKTDQETGRNITELKEGQTRKLDDLPMRLIKNFDTEFRLVDLTNEGYTKEQAEVLIKAKNILKSGDETNANEALLRVKEEMADQQGIDVDEVDFDFQLEEPEPIDFAKGGRVNFGDGSDEVVEIDFASAEDKAFRDMMEAYRYYVLSGGTKPLKDYMRMSTGAGRKGGGREHFRGAKGGIVGLYI